MVLQNYDFMSDFMVNRYNYADPYRPVSILTEELTEQGQSNSVRVILEKYAKDGISPVQPGSRAQYVDSWTDDEPLDAERVDTLIDSPDLSNMDGFEVREFVESNLDSNPSSKDSDVKDADTQEVPPTEEPPTDV